MEEMKPKFKIGDKVKLKNIPSPEMNISKIKFERPINVLTDKYSFLGNYYCIWFNGEKNDQLNKDEFHEDVLEKIDN